jgi:hypothetical protein
LNSLAVGWGEIGQKEAFANDTGYKEPAIRKQQNIAMMTQRLVVFTFSSARTQRVGG